MTDSPTPNKDLPVCTTKVDSVTITIPLDDNGTPAIDIQICPKCFKATDEYASTSRGTVWVCGACKHEWYTVPVGKLGHLHPDDAAHIRRLEKQLQEYMSGAGFYHDLHCNADRRKAMGEEDTCSCYQVRRLRAAKKQLQDAEGKLAAMGEEMDKLKKVEGAK